MCWRTGSIIASTSQFRSATRVVAPSSTQQRRRHRARTHTRVCMHVHMPPGLCNLRLYIDARYYAHRPRVHPFDDHKPRLGGAAVKRKVETRTHTRSRHRAYTRWHDPIRSKSFLRTCARPFVHTFLSLSLLPRLLCLLRTDRIEAKDLDSSRRDVDI